jgi:hypothetical protein
MRRRGFPHVATSILSLRRGERGRPDTTALVLSHQEGAAKRVSNEQGQVFSSPGRGPCRSLHTGRSSAVTSRLFAARTEHLAARTATEDGGG